MKRLIDLKQGDKFRFTEQSRKELGLDQYDNMFKVLVKYGEHKRGILVRNLRTKQRIEVPAGLEIIPEKGNQLSK